MIHLHKWGHHDDITDDSWFVLHDTDTGRCWAFPPDSMTTELEYAIGWLSNGWKADSRLGEYICTVDELADKHPEYFI